MAAAGAAPNAVMTGSGMMNTASDLSEADFLRLKSLHDAFVSVGFSRRIYSGRQLEAYIKKLEKLELKARGVKQAFDLCLKREHALYERMGQYGIGSMEELFTWLEAHHA
jgi:hypothetical protein